MPGDAPTGAAEERKEMEIENPFETLRASLIPPHTSADSKTATRIRELYATHRSTRNAAQRRLLLEGAPLVVDGVLSSVVGHGDAPDWARDTRHNVTLWTRPSEELKELVQGVQERLKGVVRGKGLWYPPREALHMTVFEVAHGHPPPPPSPSAESGSEFTSLMEKLRADDHALAKALTEGAMSRPLVFDSPSLNLDVSGVALSFLPSLSATTEEDEFDILALRSHLFSTLTSHGVTPHMRYALPSAHITVARFVEGLEESLETRREEWVRVIEEVNEELGKWKGEWRMERLVLRAGMSWYGGGETVWEGGCGDAGGTAVTCTGPETE